MASRWVGLSLVFLVAACSSRNTGHAAGAHDAGTVGVSCGADGAVCTLPPPAGNEPPNTGGTKTVIAISKLYLGHTDHAGNDDPTAWKSDGYDLDGLISTAGDKNHCTLQKGADPSYVKTDGEGGIDNSFGENLMFLLEVFSPHLTLQANQSIADGSSTVLFRLDNLLDPDTSPDQNDITGAIYDGADKGSPAAFGGSDVWPVTADSVHGSVDAPSATISGSYVSGGVWVSHGKPTVVLPLVTPDYTLLFPIRKAVITMRIHGVGTSARATDGVIAGVLDPADAVAEGQKVDALYEPDCSHFTTVASQIRAAADIMADETNGDPQKTCNAISIGVDFEGVAVTLGQVAPPVAPPPDPCTQ